MEEEEKKKGGFWGEEEIVPRTILSIDAAVGQTTLFGYILNGRHGAAVACRLSSSFAVSAPMFPSPPPLSIEPGASSLSFQQVSTGWLGIVSASAAPVRIRCHNEPCVGLRRRSRDTRHRYGLERHVVF